VDAFISEHEEGFSVDGAVLKEEDGAGVGVEFPNPPSVAPATAP
jgi:hypothetical protein